MHVKVKSVTCGVRRGAGGGRGAVGGGRRAVGGRCSDRLSGSRSRTV